MPNEYNFTRENELSKPPYTNRGVTTHKNNPSHGTEIDVFYDWFEGRLIGSIDIIESRLYRLLEGYYDDLRNTRFGHKKIFIQRGWQHGIEFIKNNHVILTVNYGGINSQHGNFFRTTGHSAKEISSLLQKEFSPLDESGVLSLSSSQQMLVSRVDVAIDLRTNFLACVESALSLKDKYGFDVTQAGDWLTHGKKGRTLYLAWTKDTKLRIYEKGKEQRQKGVDIDAPLDWVRFEVEIRAPKGKQNRLFRKILASQTAKATLQGFEPYVDVLRHIGMSSIEYVPFRRTVKPLRSSFEQKQLNMVNQYGNHLLETFETHDRFLSLISLLYPLSEDIPAYLRHLAAKILDEREFLKHGEY